MISVTGFIYGFCFNILFNDCFRDSKNSNNPSRNLSAYQSFLKKKSFFRNEFFMMKTNTEHLVYMISESLFLEMKTT